VQRFPGLNRPRDNVSWFDALAYCRWLTARLRDSEFHEDGIIGEVIKLIKQGGWEIRLPTEWEWQMAATAGDADYLFPWGIDWEDRRAHTKHNQLNQSMPVGMYLDGASPAGVMDMSGNIWEWCMNAYENPQDIRYASGDHRVLRGGSWYHWGSYAHVHMRLRYQPDFRWNAGGFRLVCGPQIAG
jgi:formylglycine-generating enzyme required for sulfatase activity